MRGPLCYKLYVVISYWKSYKIIPSVVIDSSRTVYQKMSRWDILKPNSRMCVGAFNFKFTPFDNKEEVMWLWGCGCVWEMTRTINCNGHALPAASHTYQTCCARIHLNCTDQNELKSSLLSQGWYSKAKTRPNAPTDSLRCIQQLS